MHLFCQPAQWVMKVAAVNGSRLLDHFGFFNMHPKSSSCHATWCKKTVQHGLVRCIVHFLFIFERWNFFFIVGRKAPSVSFGQFSVDIQGRFSFFFCIVFLQKSFQNIALSAIQHVFAVRRCTNNERADGTHACFTVADTFTKKKKKLEQQKIIKKIAPWSIPGEQKNTRKMTAGIDAKAFFVFPYHQPRIKRATDSAPLSAHKCWWEMFAVATACNVPIWPGD